MIICKRCGQCCTWICQGIEKRCKFLIGKVGKITTCRIYKTHNREGAVLGICGSHTIICKPREAVKRNFEGCPFNNEHNV